MIKVLHIARYKNNLTERKVDLMAQDTDLVFYRIRPRHYEDPYGNLTSPESKEKKGATSFVRLFGTHTDPHRVLYGSFAFSLKSFKPDIIHCEDEPDSLAALQVIAARALIARRTKLILHTWQNINRPKGPLVRLVVHASFRASKAILCSNSEGVGVLREMGFKGLTELIPPEGIDTDRFKPSEATQPKAFFTLLYAGRFAEEKGLDTLLEAMSLVGRDCSLVLVGAGPLKDSLLAQAKRLRIDKNVQFHQPVEQDRMPQLYARADALILPSRGTPVWKEQYGRVLLEAMACKVPVIGSSSGAIPEVIGDGGLVFQEDDPYSLSHCILTLMDDPRLQRDLAENGRQRVLNFFSQEQIARKTAAFYRVVLDSDNHHEQHN